MNTTIVHEPVNQEHSVLVMPGVNRPMRQVRHEDAPLWGDALARGMARAVSIQQGQTVHALGAEMRGYTVPERHNSGRRFGVVIARDYAGDVWVGCGCNDERPCHHVALAITDAGWWPAGMDLTRRAEDPPLQLLSFLVGGAS